MHTDKGDLDPKNMDDALFRAIVHLKSSPDQDDLQSNGTIVVGLGDPASQDDKGACILNHKGSSRPARSVTQFVVEADEALVARWRACIGAEGVRRIVVEDLSLDTCFAVKTFLHRMAGKTFEDARLDNWVQYVSDWEQGHYPDKGSSPRDSVACLASLLGHSYLATGDVKAGLLAMGDFLWALIMAFPSPRSVSFDTRSPHYRRAIARYDYEYGQLRTTVEYGATFQVMLPVGEGQETMLTDAIALRESRDLSAILKVFLRNDDEFSWAKRGFGLIALHRPNEQGSGNEMTISLDPDINLSLDGLWQTLEELENQRWKGKRPRGEGHGRRLQSYLDQGVAAEEWPHQPWYDGRSGGARWSTLLGAPKSIRVAGAEMPGSKLDWNDDVLPALWRTYSPIPDGIDVTKTVEISGKRIASVAWNASARREIIETPSFRGWLAACSMEIEIKGPLDIPRPKAYHMLDLPGGFAIVHHQGVTLFDEAASMPFNCQLFTDAVKRMSDSFAVYQKFMHGNWLQQALEGQSRLRANGAKFDIKDFHRWQQQAAEAKSALLEAMKDRLSQVETYEQSELRKLLERVWGLGERREELLEMVERFDQVVQQIFGQLREKRDRFFNSLLSGVGSGLLGIAILEPFKDKFTMNMYEWQIQLLRSAIESVKCMLTIPPFKCPINLYGDNLDHLSAVAMYVEKWEWVRLGVFIVFSALGFCLYWFKGAKLGAGSAE